MSPAQRLEAVDVGVAGLEADPLVEAVGRLPARSRGQVDGAGPQAAGQVQREPVELLAHPPTAGGAVDDDVLDPGPDPGRDGEHHQRHGPQDGPVVVAGEQQMAGVGGGDRFEQDSRSGGGPTTRAGGSGRPWRPRGRRSTSGCILRPAWGRNATPGPIRRPAPIRWDRWRPEVGGQPHGAQSVMVAAFEGWNDAGDAATQAVDHLSDAWGAAPVRLDRSRGVLRLHRHPTPGARSTTGATRGIRWPENEFGWAAAVGATPGCRPAPGRRAAAALADLLRPGPRGGRGGRLPVRPDARRAAGRRRPHPPDAGVRQRLRPARDRRR